LGRRSIRVNRFGDILHLEALRHGSLAEADAPAARRNHQAHEGGLVQHLLEIWALWEPSKPRAIALSHPISRPSVSIKRLDLD
jgi:hypothetical protein